MKTRLQRLSSPLTRQAGEVFAYWIRQSAEENTRRVVAIFGEDRYKFAGILAGTLAYRNARRIRKSQTCVYVADTFSTPFQIFKKFFLRQLPAPHHRARTFLREVVWERVWTRLGTTNEILVLDFSESLWPNRIGMIVETLRGGGMAFFLFPHRDTWLHSPLKHQAYLSSPPYTTADVSSTFEQFFLEHLWHPGVMQIHLDEGWFTFQHAPPSSYPHESVHQPDEPSLEHPHGRIRQLARTQDQAHALDALIQFSGETHQPTPPYFLLLADRGRGKSYGLGLFLGILAAIRPLNVGLIVPHGEGRNAILAGLRRACRALRLVVQETSDLIEVGNLRIRFYSPADLFPAGLDLIVVDEAARIPIPQLMHLANLAPKAIFTTTVHGYEGTGRGFLLRFQKHLESKGVWVVSMNEPIRYALGDPVESWLYQTLLLDAEPEPLQDPDPHAFPLQRLDRRSLFLSREKERCLRNFVGIYVHAHYRNEPNDLLILANAPHMEAWGLGERSEAAALEVAYEGSLSQDQIEKLLSDYEVHQQLQGHVLPALMIRYHGEVILPRYPGTRVVRIAVHPDHFGKGLGSSLIERYLRHIQMTLAWVGTSFGLTPDLIRFWRRMKFVPFHVAPGRNPHSGEYSSAWLYPLRQDVALRVKHMGKKLRERLVDLLDRTYRDMDPDLVLLLLESLPLGSCLPFPLSDDAWFRVQRFQNRLLPWGMVWDVARALAIHHFLCPVPSFSYEENLLILENFLRGDPSILEKLAQRTGDSPRWWKARAHEIFNILIQHKAEKTPHA